MTIYCKVTFKQESRNIPVFTQTQYILYWVLNFQTKISVNISHTFLNFEWFPLLFSVKIGATCQQKKNHQRRGVKASSKRDIMCKTALSQKHCKQQIFNDLCILKKHYKVEKIFTRLLLCYLKQLFSLGRENSMLNAYFYFFLLNFYGKKMLISKLYSFYLLKSRTQFQQT